MRRAGRVLLLAAIVAVLIGVLELLHVSAATLIGSLAGALAFSLVLRQELRFPEPLYLLGQAMLGASIGASIDLDTLRSIGGDWPVVLLVSVATILGSVVLGLMLSARGTITRETAVFSSVPGGASGLTVMSRDLGADDRVVTVLQYLRVVIIVASLPFIVNLVFHPSDSGGSARIASTEHLLPALLFTAFSVAVGLVLGRLARLPAGGVFGPMLVAAIVHGWFGAVGVPNALQQAAFVLIGLSVGLRFTRAAFATIRSLLPLALLNIVIVMIMCAALGAWLAHVTDLSPLDGYLATTPGGFSAVLAIATTTGGDLTFVTAAQLVRLLMILAGAPIFAWFLRRR
ncbi:AbrB family transcriptional regulator [Aeromicrobium piscarium]|uniref:AbrB family transcriptional regulator n=1 Tax=Aeromicrobium piscarium TaxID=2590901 RepID=A0A554SA18_9ACTN|nr:AbrB family transcriptional regulator [Aeromicrobium piscarium]TSD63191.1 AbrB family transcriptional regulator [Aeromicrobium piscarium]